MSKVHSRSERGHSRRFWPRDEHPALPAWADEDVSHPRITPSRPIAPPNPFDPSRPFPPSRSFPPSRPIDPSRPNVRGGQAYGAQSHRQVPYRPSMEGRDQQAIWYAAALTLITLLVPLHRVWAIQVILVILLMTVPGILLLRVLRVPGRSIIRFPVYIPCASIIVLLASGLAVDVVGRLIGISGPLNTLPLLVVFELTCCSLLVAGRRPSAELAIPWRQLSRPVDLVWPLAVPLLTGIGAIRLDNNHDSSVAVIAALGAVVLLAVGISLASGLQDPLLAAILYATGLATMWAYSLRGAVVYGYDIATEYQRLQQTIQTHVWTAGHAGDAYGAMLSVTVLPSELHFLSGVSAVSVLRLVYPAISAFFPMAIFCLARRVLSRRWAFAAGAFTIAQASFAKEFPTLARQEIGLLLFAALIATIAEQGLRRRSQWWLVALLSLGMAVSHYSTTYAAIAVLAVAVPIQFLTSPFSRGRRVTGSVVVALAAAAAGALVWYGPVTESGTGIGYMMKSFQQYGLDLLPRSVQGQSLLAAYFGTGERTLPATQYAQDVHTQYVMGDPTIVPASTAPSFPVEDSAAPARPVTLGRVSSLLNLGALVTQQLLNVCGALGSIILAFRRRASDTARLIGLLGIGAGLFLVVIRVSGTLATFYNQDRAVLQALAVFAICFCWFGQRASKPRTRRRKIIHRVAVASLVVFMLNTAGLLAATFGGAVGMNLTDSGEDFERYNSTVANLAAARWLGYEVKVGRREQGHDQLIYADRYAQLPLMEATGIGGNAVDQNVTPFTINARAWIYADGANIVERRGRTLYLDYYYVTYKFPTSFLNSAFDTVYTNGTARVYWQ